MYNMNNVSRITDMQQFMELVKAARERNNTVSHKASKVAGTAHLQNMKTTMQTSNINGYNTIRPTNQVQQGNMMSARKSGTLFDAYA